MAETQYKGSNTWRGYISSLASGDLLTAALLYTTGIRYLTDRTRWAGHRLRQLFQESVTFTADAAADTISISDHLLLDGACVVLSTTTTLPSGLSASPVSYYIINADSDNGTAQLSLTLGGSAVNITSAGTGTHSLYVVRETLGMTLLTDATQDISMPSGTGYLCSTPASARTLTPLDSRGKHGQRFKVTRPSTGANEILIARETSGDSMAHLTSSKHCSVDLEYYGTAGSGGKWRVVGLSVDATIGIDP